MKAKCPVCKSEPQFTVICGGTMLMLECHADGHSLSITSPLSTPGADALCDAKEVLRDYWCAAINKENNDAP